MENLAQPLVMTRADLESRLTDDHHDALRLWLRLLTCTTLIERGIRRRLRERYGMTLGRCDRRAQLGRFPAGLRMGGLSRRLMVTGGNVTGLVAQLVDEGLVERTAVPHDRRAHVVRLTVRGREAVAAMAISHERWIVEMTAISIRTTAIGCTRCSGASRTRCGRASAMRTATTARMPEPP